MLRCCAMTAVASLALLATARVQAGTITFTYRATGSGSIGATAFSDKQFTMTAVGSTDERFAWPSGGYTTPIETASISIDGVGTYSFSTALAAFVNNTSKTCGFRAAVWPNVDLCYMPSTSALSTWDMLASIGPIAGTSTLLQWSNQTISTTGGQLIFRTASPAGSSFQAALTGAPEPSSLVLLSVGSVAFLAYTRRRR